MTYRVYTPAGYHGGQESYPAVYFTDGHEYADSEMGRAIEILDNGIADGVLPPLVAVFLDPRDPRDDRNRRAWEYAEFPEKYSRIVVDEIVPAVDDAFRTKREAGHRVLIGTSLGALFALHVALAHGATFGGVVAQSPAMEYDEYARGDRLRDEIVSASGGKTRIFLDVGTMHDDLARTRATRAQLEAAGFPVRWTEVHEGHSWGHWRAWIDDGIRFGLGID